MKENRALEFKTDITNTFLKTVSAYANFRDGIILFGVSDTGEAIGLDDPIAACLAIENKINDAISPKPDFSLEINQRTKVVTLSVKEGPDKPYLYHGKAYRRSDTATVEVDHQELRRLTLLGEGKSYDGLPAREDTLQFQALGNVLKQKLGITAISLDILKTLNLYSEHTGYNHAAELIADVNDFPGTDIARFGNDIDVILDRKQLIHISILQQYEEAVRFFQTYYQYEKIEGMERKAKELIPEKAFREALVNALVHRTWDIHANIRIAMFPDHLEISSPGGLPFGVSKESYLHGYVSVLRNPIIASLFFRIHLIEMFGTGVKRIIDAYRDCDIKPTFTISEQAIVISLPCIGSRKRMTADENTIYQIFSKGRILSRTEISAQSGFEKSKTLRIVNALLEKGYIKKSGTGRGTKYYSPQ